MMQRPKGRGYRDKRIMRDWEIRPACNAGGEASLLHVRLGPDFEVYASRGFAIALANALATMKRNTNITNTLTRKGEQNVRGTLTVRGTQPHTSRDRQNRRGKTRQR